MVGSMAMRPPHEQRSWEIHYSRFFSFLPPSASASPSSSSLSPITKRFFRPSWLSSATPTAILSLSADPSRSDFILTIFFQGIILEQHYVSKMSFSWPQLSCVTNVPQQSSRVVLVSYRDGASVTQKFGLRFSTYYDVGDFVTMLEDGLSNKQHLKDFTSTTNTTQSEAKDMFNEVVLSGASQIHDMNPVPHQLKSGQEITASLSSESYIPSISEGYVPDISECYVPEISEGYPPCLPPRFTSYVTDCSMMAKGQGDVAASAPTASNEVDLKSLIAHYLEDATFLDILSKAEELIAELGDGWSIQQFL